MIAVMHELVRQKYSRLGVTRNTHAGWMPTATCQTSKRATQGGGSYNGYAFNVGYTRTALQAALASVRRR